jgi:malate dehydrogenase
MSIVAILGAGEIGGSVARALAIRARVEVVRLIDESVNVAAGKALDLSQAAPVFSSDTKIQSAQDLAAAADARAIVIADPAGSPGEWNGESGLALLRRLGRSGYLERSVLIFAGANQLDLMQQAVDELKLSRRRTLGSAPESLAAIARALVAIEAKASSAQVALSVLGRPPAKIVIPWTEASVAGNAVFTLLSPPQIHRVERRLRGVWPPGPAALGTAAALLAESVLVGSRRLWSAFVSLDRDNGTKAPVCAWPVSLGPDGLERVATPALTGRDRVMMDEVLE